MDKDSLRDLCTQRYGEVIGESLYEVMMQIHKKDFCVATAWSPYEISIARSCCNRGRVFSLSKDHKHLFMPKGDMRSIESLTYKDIAKYLPKTALGDNYEHCSLDRNEMLSKNIKNDIEKEIRNI